MISPSLCPQEYQRYSSAEKPKHARHSTLISSTLCHSIDLSDTQPPASPNGDIGRRQLVQLHHFKQVLWLVMLCSTVCWISLTTTFALLIIRETVMLPSTSSAYVIRYAVVLIFLFTAWGASAAACMWRYNRYRFQVSSQLAAVDWMAVGAPPVRASSDTVVSK
ncbi:hypothetical protein BX667DRAFT_493400 [Coemansia mojavensis]|nr:hypothetical protein BX667DRAFT_493400 [Coemansia mojavensis]